jgi:2-keto-4-pentenoate hydratase
MSQNSLDLEQVALLLDQAEQRRTSIEPLSERYAAFDAAQAYAIQRHWLSQKLARGEQLVGHKVGLTSKAMQEQMGVDQPDYGFLLASMVLPSGSTLSTDELIQARIEPEIAFWLAEDLRGPGVTVADVLAATRGVSAALEVVDSRIKDWRIRLADTIADNASSARVIVSAEIVPPQELDLQAEAVALTRNGSPTGTGDGRAVLGHPAAAVAWLVNKLAEFETGLRAGELVLPGAMCASVPVARGDRFVATFTRLGSVAVQFA